MEKAARCNVGKMRERLDLAQERVDRTKDRQAQAQGAIQRAEGAKTKAMGDSAHLAKRIERETEYIKNTKVKMELENKAGNAHEEYALSKIISSSEAAIADAKAQIQSLAVFAEEQ